MSDQTVDMVLSIEHASAQFRAGYERGAADLAAATALAARLAQDNAALREALAPVLAYLVALVESADQQGHLREGDVRSDKLAAMNDVWLLRSDIAALAAAAPARAPAETVEVNDAR